MKLIAVKQSHATLIWRSGTVLSLMATHFNNTVIASIGFCALAVATFATGTIRS